MRFLFSIIIYFVFLSNTLYSQDRYDSFSNWLNQLPQYGYDGMKNAFSTRSNLLIIGGAGISSLIAAKYDKQFQEYSQSHGLLPSNISKFGDLYGGVWSAWLLPVSVIVTSKIKNDSNKEMLQKLDYTVSALTANGVTTLILKEIIGRQRPNDKGNHSMPSGHTSHSFAVASIANELYGNGVGIAAYLLAGLVGISRIQDNKHYLTDVIIGAGIGTVIGRGFAKTYNKYKSNSKNTIDLSISFNLNY